MVSCSFVLYCEREPVLGHCSGQCENTESSLYQSVYTLTSLVFWFFLVGFFHFPPFSNSLPVAGQTAFAPCGFWQLEAPFTMCRADSDGKCCCGRGNCPFLLLKLLVTVRKMVLMTPPHGRVALTLHIHPTSPRHLAVCCPLLCLCRKGWKSEPVCLMGVSFLLLTRGSVLLCGGLCLVPLNFE